MKTIDVFGVSNSNIASYIQREDVDSRFLEGLKRNKHIVVFGSSKQGKTALTNKHLKESDFVRVNCSPETEPIDIYKSILRQLKVEFEEEKTTNSSDEISSKIGLKAKVKIPFFADSEAQGEMALKGSSGEQSKYKHIEYNLALPQDISEILKSNNFTKRIILENFHYLEESAQQDMAFHLRVFEDYNILFIILGIWREKNRLAQFNGDLQDRLIEIPVEPWKREDFQKVVEVGENLLNVSFQDVFETIIDNSFDSIGVFQELCKECCLAAEVETTQEDRHFILQENLNTAIARKVEDYTGRHIRSLETFVEQKVKKTDEIPLYIAYYFVKYLFSLTSLNIEAGLKRPDILGGIQANHHRPSDVRSSDMSYFLHNLTATQIKKNIIPPLFDYDRSTRKLKVIDSTLYFFLKNIDKDELFEEFDKPAGI
ncbi:ATP-binding protein [Sulfurospirillum sp. hDNRA2]|uniref:ATP-binding protein n=1 Tax=Sulfurospirillum sp. hDNRA2 TaxID=3237298 RepID=UPI0020B64BF1|nr:ATP-binding protein [Sulfurospirillum sp. DNRA8]MCP3651283.1 ATP-binding protein [Sulfurospirillum sp. DNRA8]MCR1810130.1 ATP-binding protein [Sulfurospirillum sp. DNRA8]